MIKRKANRGSVGASHYICIGVGVGGWGAGGSQGFRSCAEVIIFGLSPCGDLQIYIVNFHTFITKHYKTMLGEYH